MIYDSKRVLNFDIQPRRVLMRQLREGEMEGREEEESSFASCRFKVFSAGGGREEEGGGDRPPRKKLVATPAISGHER